MSYFCSVVCLIVIRLWCVSPCKNQTDLFYFALRQFRKPISLWHIRLVLFPKSAWNDHQNDEQISILCILSLLYLSNYEINTWQGCTFWSPKLEPSEVCQTFALKSLDFCSEVDKKWQIRNDNMALNLLGNKLIIWFQTRVCQVWTATYAFSYVYFTCAILTFCCSFVVYFLSDLFQKFSHSIRSLFFKDQLSMKFPLIVPGLVFVLLEALVRSCSDLAAFIVRFFLSDPVF